MTDWQAVALEACVHRFAMQNPGELAQVLAEVAQLEPAVIAEIGVSEGGTLWCWSHMPAAQVYAITLPVPGPAWVHAHGAVLDFADSRDPATRDRLAAWLDGRPVDVLFIDGDHTEEGVAADYAGYGPYVRDGGLIIFHDIEFMPGVAKFWALLAAEHGAAARAILSSPAGPWTETPGTGILTVGRKRQWKM